MALHTGDELETARDEAARLLLAYAAAVARVRELERERSGKHAAIPAKVHSVPEVYSPKTLAERWRCSERHVRNLIKRGELNSFTFGGRLCRIRAADVKAYEERALV